MRSTNLPQKIPDLLLTLLAALAVLLFIAAPWLDGRVLSAYLPESLSGLSLLGWTASRGYILTVVFFALLVLLLGLLALSIMRLANVNLGRFRSGIGAALLVFFRLDRYDFERSTARLGLALVGIALLLMALLFMTISEAVQSGYWATFVLLGIDGLIFAGHLGAFTNVARFMRPKPIRPHYRTDGSPPGNARLYVLSGPLQGRREYITQQTYTIGRKPENDLVLWSETTVSREAHATIVYSQDMYFLRARSPNQKVLVGTSPHQLKQELSYRLSSEDYFQIGESLTQFKIER